MTKPHLTTNRDRLSARYKALHNALKAELKQAEPSKALRKRQASQSFRQTGE